MGSNLQVTPSPTTGSHHKLRAFTREACRLCREKKFKCDGGRPCSRCMSRRAVCEYQPQPPKTKHNLLLELEELKDAQRQRDAVLESLAAPDQTHDTLLRLWSSESPETIYQHLKNQGLSPSQSNCNVVDGSGQPLEKGGDTSTGPVQTSSSFPSNLDYSIPAQVYQSGTRHIQEAVENQSLTSALVQPELDSGNVDTSVTGSIVSPNDMDQFDNIAYNPTTTSELSMESRTSLMSFDTHSTDDVNCWTPSDFDPERFNSDVPSSLNWFYPQYAIPYHSQPPGSYSIASASLSPITNDSSFAPHHTSCEVDSLCRPVDVAVAAESENSTHPPPKKRKSNTDYSGSVTFVGVNEDHQGKDNNAAGKKTKSTSPDQQESNRDRERHRKASARNWQKQKQQMANLEVAKNMAEARNRELHREHSQLLSQVMEAKNALMHHAKCNHPAINNWLHCQATNYVLSSGVQDTHQKRRVKSRMPAPTREL